MKILALSGSLRAASSNSTLLRAAVRLAPEGVGVVLYDGLGGLPHFNPDLDRTLDDPLLPAAVRDLRQRVGEADALLICCPEYAHGVPGSFKNALDWLVGGSEMPGMPVALVNASPRSVHAQASLVEILRTMSAQVVPGSPFPVGLSGSGLDEDGMVANPEVRSTLEAVFAALAEAVAMRRGRASAGGDGA